MGALGIMMLRRGTMANPIAGSDYILSETQGDPEVFRILMGKGVSSDGIGITKDDAAKVSSISNWFTGNANIESFDEFKFFTGVTRLGEDMRSGGTRDAFSECTNLRSIELPESLLYIGTFGFFKCTSLEHIGMTESIVKIGSGAFRSVPASMVINLPNLVEVPHFSDVNLSYAFRSSGVTRIENFGSVPQTYGQWNSDSAQRYGLFYECTDLEYADVSELITMGACMFGKCTSLRTVIMDKVQTINAGAFILCNALEVLRLPSSVVKVGDFAISYSSQLHTIIVEATTPPTITANSINEVGALTSIYVPDDSVEAYKSANIWRQKWASIIKPLSEYNG